MFFRDAASSEFVSDSSFPVIHKVGNIIIFVQILMEISFNWLRAQSFSKKIYIWITKPTLWNTEKLDLIFWEFTHFVWFCLKHFLFILFYRKIRFMFISFWKDLFLYFIFTIQRSMKCDRESAPTSADMDGYWDHVILIHLFKRSETLINTIDRLVTSWK